MIERWFEHIELPISIEQFHVLPRNSAYKYEYFDGAAHLSGRLKCYHALLDVSRFEAEAHVPDLPDDVQFRPFHTDDWGHLVSLFARSFHAVQPFASLSDELRHDAARGCLHRTRTGGDGDLVPSACFTAWAESTTDEPPDCIGAVLITLLTGKYALDFAEFERIDGSEGDNELADEAAPEPPPPIPHLTWIFVEPWSTREGIGMALLRAATRAIRALGYDRLGSTFLLGNDASTLWHWRAGFRVMSYAGAFRFGRRWRRARAAPKRSETGTSSVASESRRLGRDPA